MKLFKSHDPNTFHYTTSVCYKRVPVFSCERACEFFIEALSETKTLLPLKLIGYVIMPDHTHLILNPLACDIRKVRAGLCKHPAEWKWSSYRAYLPHEPGSVPIEMDLRGYWSKDELELAVEPAGGARL
jgi:hypothetical protein